MKASSIAVLAILLSTVCCAVASSSVFDVLRGLDVAVVYGSRAADTDLKAALKLAELAAELGYEASVIDSLSSPSSLMQA